jgi:hypothetical protein
MKSSGATFRKHSSAGVDWASWFLGIGLGLTLALQATTMRKSDISTVYAVVASVSRLAALTGTVFAVVGIFLIARIPWVERGVGHDRLVTWHRKLGPWSLYLIGAHVFFIVMSSAGQDGAMLAVEMWQMLNSMAWMWPALAGFILMVMAGVTSYKKARAKLSYRHGGLSMSIHTLRLQHRLCTKWLMARCLWDIHLIVCIGLFSM